MDNNRLRVLFSLKKNTIFETTLPYYYLLRAVGYGCFTITDTYDQTPFDSTVTKPIDVVLFIAIQIYNLFCVHESVFYEPSNDVSENSVVSNFVMKLILWISLLNSIIGTIIVLIEKSSMFSALRKMHTIDVELKSFGMGINLSYYFIMSLILSTIQTTVLLINLYLQYLPLGFSYLTMIYGFMPNGNYATLMSTYMIFTKNIQIRLSSIRKYVFDGVNAEKINRGGLMYERIYQSTEEVYSVLSFQIMLCFLHCYVYVVFAIFAIYRILYNDIFFEEYYNVVVYGCWSSFYVVSVILVIVVTSSIHKEYYRFKMDVAVAINSMSSNFGGQKNKLLSLLNFLEHCKPKMRCVFFNFDWKLITMMTASMATNVVVLLQFETSIGEMVHEKV